MIGGRLGESLLLPCINHIQVEMWLDPCLPCSSCSDIPITWSVSPDSPACGDAATAPRYRLIRHPATSVRPGGGFHLRSVQGPEPPDRSPVFNQSVSASYLISYHPILDGDSLISVFFNEMWENLRSMNGNAIVNPSTNLENL
ncbi:hypothetical protein RRG08_006241 [Elysia crispata]|uniref:Uncharacterized protein n=1 Tax=Elysia crispata TaxID=231223 RepID=A0AAE1D320_9GAST|nr:hypothetical protein RRG08_006241 [Elysia crispata]